MFNHGHHYGVWSIYWSMTGAELSNADRFGMETQKTRRSLSWNSVITNRLPWPKGCGHILKAKDVSPSPTIDGVDYFLTHYPADGVLPGQPTNNGAAFFVLLPIDRRERTPWLIRTLAKPSKKRYQPATMPLPPKPKISRPLPRPVSLRPK